MKQVLAPLQHEHAVETESILEQERLSIARDLQDKLGEQLSLMHMDLVKLCGNINQTHQDLQGAASLVMQRFSVVMQSLLTVIRGLRSRVFNRGFCSAVEWQCEEFSRRFDMKLHMCWSSDNIPFPKGLSLILFRAFQEAVKNVHYHAQASYAYVIVNTDKHTVAMTVVGDNNAVALGNQNESNLDQLAGLKGRITDLGGKVSLLSAQNKGVSLNIELPLGGRWAEIAA